MFEMATQTAVSGPARSCLPLHCLQLQSIFLTMNPPRNQCSRSEMTGHPLLTMNVSAPPYRSVTPDVVKCDISILIISTRKNFTNFEKQLDLMNVFTWHEVMEMPDRLTDRLGMAWGVVSHLHGVKETPELRDVYEDIQPEMVSLMSNITQSQPSYRALKYLSADLTPFDKTQRRIIDQSLKAAHLSGIHLTGEKKDRFNVLLQMSSEIGTNYSNNVLDSTKNFSYMVYDKKDLDGVPQTALALLASSAGQQLNKSIDPAVGPWKLSLDMPAYEPLMKHCQNRDLRQMMYRAFVSRASTGETDNSNIINQIREFRREKANLLGFPNFAAMSLERKMAENASNVWKMIDELLVKVRPVAQKELQQLKDFAVANGHMGDFMNWDVGFWSEKQKETLYNLNEEELRPYFPFEVVLTGLFSLSSELFEITITEVEKSDFESWDDEVRFFRVFNKQKEHVASFYLDAFSRPAQKKAGAWMNSALDRNDKLDRKPIAYLVCNQNPPLHGQPSLMNLREITTLFHEFGHGLQHMLTNVTYPEVTGINGIEWDAVELPSQFMENWVYDWNTMKKISKHNETEDHLPRNIFDRIIKSRNYQAGMMNLRQLYFSAVDIVLHTSDEDWRSITARMQPDYTVMKPLKEDCFLCSFSHVFAGSYAAGYYSYKWAEVLSIDAFSIFEEEGLDDRLAVGVLGRRFRDTVLSQGGSRHAKEIFEEFRGRAPSITALLKYYGINS